LIPLYGALGAAMATCLAFFIMFLVMYRWNTKLYPIQLEWKKLCFITVFLIGGFLVSNAANDNQFTNILITGLYPIGLIGFNVIRFDLLKEWASRLL
jgi:O-antigen/teichoic acid export membrane protein